MPRRQWLSKLEGIYCYRAHWQDDSR